jgi:hypothetical protein
VIEKRNRLNQIEAQVNLEKVLDLGYARASELLEFLEVFLEKQPTIILDNRALLEARLKRAEATQERCLIESEQARREATEVRAALEELDGCSRSS